MSKLTEFKALESRLTDWLKQLSILKSDEGLKREIGYENEL